jgi:hypothetical protein
MTPSLLKSIREKAMAATLGEWKSRGRYVGTPYHMSFICETRSENGTWSDTEKSVADAAYIAAANPETVLQLLDYITQLEGEAEALRGVLNVACEEIYDLRRYANNHGGMIDCEKFTEGLAALAALPPSQGGDAG